MPVGATGPRMTSMVGYAPFFEDRTDAGRQLAERMVGLQLQNPVVFALPRGGAPGAPELALGAVVDGGQTVVNPEVQRLTVASREYLERETQRELAEIERR